MSTRLKRGAIRAMCLLTGFGAVILAMIGAAALARMALTLFKP